MTIQQNWKLEKLSGELKTIKRKSGYREVFTKFFGKLKVLALKKLKMQTVSVTIIVIYIVKLISQ